DRVWIENNRKNVQTDPDHGLIKGYDKAALIAQVQAAAIVFAHAGSIIHIHECIAAEAQIEGGKMGNRYGIKSMAWAKMLFEHVSLMFHVVHVFSLRGTETQKKQKQSG